MQIRSWHLALLGFLFFAIHLSSNIAANNIKCNGNYEIGASDCHNEFSGLAMVLTFAQTLVLAFPIVLLGVEKSAAKSKVVKWWIITVFCLCLWCVMTMVFNRIIHMHPDEIADLLDGGITLFFWEIFYTSPLIFVGGLIVNLLNRWRQKIGAIICILLGSLMMIIIVGVFDYWGSVAGVSLLWKSIIITTLLFSALMYLSAGFFFFLKENTDDKNDAILK